MTRRLMIPALIRLVWPIGVVVLSFVLALHPVPAHAQATGALTGLLTDASGDVLPGVTIEIANDATGQVRTVETASDGFFTLPLVTPGRYTVKASLNGFRTTVQPGVVVTVNNTTRVDLKLQVGAVEEQVTVTTEPRLVETSHATLGVVIDQEKVVDLPLNDRNFTQLGTLIPGVVAPPSALGGQTGDATPGGFGNATGGFNVNGMRNQSNNFLLDGAGNNDTFNTGFVLRPPPDAIQEFKILTHSYGAEYGRNAGSVVNVVTRSGTNQWHGAAWEFNRDDAFEAKNYFAVTKPTLKQNQFGGSLGAPIVRNKIFAFGYYEGYRNTRGTTNTSTVLSAAQRTGDFSGGAAIKDPLTGLPFSGNVIPAERISPIARQILDTYVPLPNGANNRYTKSPDVVDDRDQFGIRGDVRLTDAHSMLGRVMYANTEKHDPITTPTATFSPAGNIAKASLSDVLFSDTLFLKSNVINVGRVSFNRIDAHPQVTSGLDPRDLGWNITQSNALAAGLPYININGFFTAGDVQQPFASRINEVFAIGDDLSWVSGRHAFKFGAEIRRDHIKLAYINRPNGDFTFNGQYTGSAAADFLLGFVQQYRQGSGDPNLDGSTWAYSGYAQDEYRLTSRITLNLGVRYELVSPFVEKDDKLNTFRPGQQSTRFPTAPTGLVYPGDAGIPRGTYETDTNNIAPRLGLVWDPRGSGQTSVRAAWGLFYDTLPGQGDFFQNGTLAPPFQPLTEVTYPVNATTPSLQDPLRGIGGAAGFPAGLVFIGWGPDFTTPVVQHYNLTVQHQALERLGVEVGYVGSRGEHLPMFMEINPTTPNLTTATRGPRLYPALGLVRPTFSVAKSWYDSFQASARLMPWHRINALASYTWSHAIDHVSGLNIGGESRPVRPVTIGDEASIDAALGREKGDALFDARHRFVVSFGAELPALDRWHPLARAALGGWQVNGIVQKQTGFPLTVTESNDIALLTLTNRPAASCDPNDGAPHTTGQWFNTSCFQRLTLPANAGQFGNAGRNTVRGPGFARTDLSLFKNFDLPGKQRVQLRVEAFNLFDQERFGQPGGNIGAPTTFGIITSAEDGRIVQLGIKYQF